MLACWSFPSFHYPEYVLYRTFPKILPLIHLMHTCSMCFREVIRHTILLKYPYYNWPKNQKQKTYSTSLFKCSILQLTHQRTRRITWIRNTHWVLPLPLAMSMNHSGTVGTEEIVACCLICLFICCSLCTVVVKLQCFCNLQVRMGTDFQKYLS